jgi:hypothetical protein
VAWAKEEAKVGAHKTEPTAQERKKKMREQIGQQPAGATTVAA